ncbi:unnamed protein product, partial [Allacma fusca]
MQNSDIEDPDSEDVVEIANKSEAENLTLSKRKKPTALQKYYPTSDGEAYIVSTVLDPRCKLEFYKAAHWKKDWIDSSKKMVTDVWKSNYKGIDQPNDLELVSDQPSTSGSIFENMFGSSNANKKTIEDDLTRYLGSKTVHPDMLKKELTGIDGALGWWK